MRKKKIKVSGPNSLVTLNSEKSKYVLYYCGISLPLTCKKNYVNMQDNNVNIIPLREYADM